MSSRFKRITHLPSPLLVDLCAGQLREGESRLVILGFTHCDSKNNNEI